MGGADRPEPRRLIGLISKQDKWKQPVIIYKSRFQASLLLERLREVNALARFHALRIRPPPRLRQPAVAPLPMPICCKSSLPHLYRADTGSRAKKSIIITFDGPVEEWQARCRNREERNLLPVNRGWRNSRKLDPDYPNSGKFFLAAASSARSTSDYRNSLLECGVYNAAVSENASYSNLKGSARNQAASYLHSRRGSDGTPRGLCFRPVTRAAGQFGGGDGWLIQSSVCSLCRQEPGFLLIHPALAPNTNLHTIVRSTQPHATQCYFLRLGNIL